MKKRRNHVAGFKDRVALEAVMGERTVCKLAVEYGVDPKMIHQWNKALLVAAAAGAANAGGLFALGQYTSHMTEYLSQLADNLVLGNLWVLLIAVLALAPFITGAGFSTFLINWERLNSARRQYVLPIALQGVFLLLFATGGMFTSDLGRLFALCCLCFIMGMQNATGMVTDIGIELGRAAFGISAPASGIRPDRSKLRILLTLVASFLVGGVVGAVGFGQIGFWFDPPLGLTLLGLAGPGLRLRL